MDQIFCKFLDNIKKNMEAKGKSNEQISKTIFQVNENYKNSPIFEEIEYSDEDIDEYLDPEEKDDRDNDIMSQMIDFNLDKDVRAQQILDWQDYYQDKNVFSEEDMESVEDIDNRGVFGRTKLHTAVLNQDLEEIEKLLDSGANANIVDNNGFTPYQTANMEGYDDILNIFVQKGITK